MADFGKAYKHVLSLPPIFFAGRAEELGNLRDAFITRGLRKVLILGRPGIGKTALSNHFATQVEDFFVGGIQRISMEEATQEELREASFVGSNPSTSGPKLLMMDGLDGLDTSLLNNILLRASQSAELRILATSRALAPGFDLEIGLDALTLSEMESVWKSNMLFLKPEEYKQLYQRIGGHPLVSTLGGRLVRDQRTTIPDLDTYLRSFFAPGLVGPDGRPLKSNSAEERQLISTVEWVSNDVLDRISNSPQDMYALSPRQFEELVASLFEKEGYQVSLTPPTRDGGKDIYVAKRDAVGSLMYLVECKRYAEDRPVGVQVIRGLYGVVEQERVTGGIVATTSSFTKKARQFSEQVQFRLGLKDYIELHKWIQSVRNVK